MAFPECPCEFRGAHRRSIALKLDPSVRLLGWERKRPFVLAWLPQSGSAGQEQIAPVSQTASG